MTAHRFRENTRPPSPVAPPGRRFLPLYVCRTARAAAALLALCGALALPATAQAQTATTLVSNIGQSTDTQETSATYSQRFTTGSNAGYTLTGIDIVSDGTRSFGAKVCEVDSSGYPTSVCTDLTPPGTFAAGTLSFTALADATLMRDTIYAVVASPTGSLMDVGVTSEEGEDMGFVAPWSIANEFDFLTTGVGATWQTNSFGGGRSMRIAIKGAAILPTLSIANASGTEGGDVTFTATLSATVGADVTATWTASIESADTAVAADDLGTAKTGQVTVPMGELTGTFDVPTAQDNADEENETFTVTLSGVSANAILGTATATGTINDDDELPVLSAAALDAEVTEGESATFTLTLSPASGKRVTIPWGAVSGTAWVGVDFPYTDAPLLYFEPGETSKTLTVPTTDDAIDEEDEETFSLDLRSGINLTYGGGAFHLRVPGTILDDDDPPTLSVDDVSAAEGGDLTFTVELSAESEREVTVDWEAAALDAEGDDAEDGTDFAAASGTLTFTPRTHGFDNVTGDLVTTPGETARTFTVSTTDDAVDEEDETFTVTLSNPTHATIPDATAKGTITSDDTPAVTNVTVTSVPVLASDTYGAGETIAVAVDFSAPVNAAAGTDFVLSVGGAKRAALLSGNGTNTLVFGYTVQAGDEDDDGIWMGDGDRTLAGNRNGTPQNGAITSVATGLDAVLDHSAPGRQSGHKVDGSRSIVSVAVTSTPALTSPGETTPDTYGVGEKILFTVTFNTAVDVAGDPVFRFALGSSDVDAALDSGAGSTALVFAHTVAPTDADDNGIFLRDEDDFNSPNGPVRLDADDTVRFAGTSTNVPLYWEGRGTQSGHKVDGSRRADNSDPTFDGMLVSLTVPENSTAGTVVVATVPATDADDDTLEYSLEGTDAASFAIDSVTSEITTVANVDYDHETKDLYSLTAKVEDGFGGSDTIPVVISVTDVAEQSDTPAAPTLAAVTGSATSLTATWAKPGKNGGPEIIGYKLEYRAGATGDWTDFPHTGTDLTATITGLAANTDYQARVQALNGETPSDWSDPSDAERTNQGASFATPAAISVAENVSAVVTVEAVDNDTGDDITGYAITGGADQALFEIVASTGVLTFKTASNFEDPNDSDTDNTYEVTIQATSGTGDREATATRTFMVTVTDAAEQPEQPAKPTLAAISDSTTSLTATWIEPGLNGGPAISGYNVQYRERPDGAWMDFTHAGTAVTATITGLTANTQYQVRVQALNGETPSEWSSPSDAERTTAGPPVLTRATVRSDSGGRAIRIQFDQDIASAPNDSELRSAFSATADGSNRNITRIGEVPGSNNVFELHVSSPFIFQGQPVELSYDRSAAGSRALANDDGTEVEDFTTGAGGVPAVVNQSNRLPLMNNFPGAAGDEDEGVEFTIRLNDNAHAEVAVTWTATIESGDTAAEADLAGGALSFGRVTIAKGERNGKFTVPIVDDAADEADETFTVTLSNPTNTTILAPTAKGTIRDDDDPPALSVADVSAPEGGVLTFTATLAPPSGKQVTVDWEAAYNDALGDTAADDGSDFTEASGTLTFQAGDTVETFTVSTTEDTAVENDETFTVTFSNASNVTLPTPPTARGTITDDDAAMNEAPSFTSDAAFDAAENQTAAGTVAATDGDADDAVTGYAISGGADQALFAIDGTTGALTFAAAPDFEDPQDSGTDNVHEVTVQATSGADAREKTATQTITVTVTNVDEGQSGTATIDNTTPMVGDELTASTADAADPDGLPDPFAPTWQWYRTPDGGSETEITGAASATYTVVEADLGAMLTAKATWTDKGAFVNTLSSAPTSAVAAASVLPTLSVDDAAGTEGGNVTFTVMLSASSTAMVTATWTASIETDDTAVAADLATTKTGMVTVTMGQDTGTFDVPTAQDTANEADETFTVTLSGVSTNAALAADPTATGTIENDDVPAAPSNFLARVGDTQVELTWDAPAPGANITRHEVRRKEGSGSYPTAFTPIEMSAPGGANQKGYTVTGLTNEVAYTFELRAVNDAGNGTADEAGPVTPTPGICGRTQQVRDGILDEVPGVTDCNEVTVANLAAITGTLDLEDEGIASLQSGDFAGLTALDRLYLPDNDFSSLPLGVFSGLTGLTRLYLHDNDDLTSLPDGVFDDVTAVESLRLHNNQLTSLPDEVFDGLMALETLHLSGNDLSSLPDEVFKDLTALTSLTLNDNDLDALPDGAFTGLTALAAGTLSLGNNPNSGDDLPLTVTVEKVGTDRARAKVAAGAPFAVDFTPTVVNGSLPASDTKLAVAAGSVDGTAQTVTRTSGTTAAVTVDIDLSTQPSLPTKHSGYEFAKATGSEPTEILSAETTLPTLSIADAAGTEGGNVTFTATLSATAAADVTVTWTASLETGNTAETGDFTDLSAATGTLTFSASTSQTMATFTVATKEDTADEEDETFTVTLSGVSTNAQLATDPTAKGTINDNDPTPTVTVADATATEGGKVEFEVTLSAVSGRDVTVDYATSVETGDTATSGTDFTAADGTLTILAANATATGTIEVQTTDDTDEEEDETFTLTLSNPTNATLGTTTAAMGTIEDDDGTMMPMTPADVLVSNYPADSPSDFNLNFNPSGAAQRHYFAETFTAGAGFTLTAVDIPFRRVPDNARVTVTLHARDGSKPGTYLANLDLSGALAAGSNTFAAPAGTALAAGTYFVRVRWREGDTSNLVMTDGPDAETSAESGWSIEDRTQYSANGSSWSNWNQQFAMRVRGTINAEPRVAIGGVRIESDPAAHDSYVAGEDIEVAVGFTDDVTVDTASGTPRIALTVGSDTRYADYSASDSDDDELAFVYTVTAADHDQDGVSIAADALELNGGAIHMDGDSSTDAVLDHAALDADSDHRVNRDPIIVSDGVSVISIPTAETDTYGLGEVIEIEVRFSAAVDATAGTDFVLSVAGARRAPLLRGSGTATLVFGYTVVAGDDDDNGIWIGDDSRTLDGNRNGEPQNGEITSAVTDRAADLDHDEVGTLSGHKVDGSRTTGNVAPNFTSSAAFDAAENQARVGIVQATDSDTDDDVTGYAITGGADETLFRISGPTGLMRFDAVPDYEDPDDSDTNNTYVVEVTATSGAGTRVMTATQTIAVTVTNADEGQSGTVTIGDTTPMVGDALTASIADAADPDGLPDPFAPTWKWYRTPDGGSETEISGETSATYTVVEADLGATLAAKASWTDNGGFANTLASAPTSAVAAASILPTLSIADASGAEDAGVTFTATLTAGVSAKVTATWTASIETDDTAVAADLATTKTGDVEFEPDAETTTFTVPVTDDSTDEDDETFTVTLSGVSTNAQLATDPTATGTIEDDDTAPTVTNVAVTSVPVLETDAYGAGEEILFTVTFSEAVTVTGDPEFAFSLDSGEDRAPYKSGSGTTALVFAYTVAPGDEDDDGIFLLDGSDFNNRVGAVTLDSDDAIEATGSTTDADLAHTGDRGTQSGHKVDGTRSIRTVEVTSTPRLETDTYGAGETIRFTVTFNVAVDVTGDPVVEFLFDGSEVRQAGYVSGGGSTALVFHYLVVSGDDDNNGLFIRDESDYNNPDGPVRLDSNDEIEFKDTSTDVPLYWSGRGTQAGHKVDGSRTTGNVAPNFTSSAAFDAAENQARVGIVQATDSDTDDDVTGYAITGGADETLFRISGPTGLMRFDAVPDYEDPDDSDTNNTYVVEVTATSGAGTRVMTATQTIAVTVTNVDEGQSGTVTIGDTTPMVGDALTASIADAADPDGLPDPFAPTWKWYRTPDGGSETEISGETSATYTVVEADLGATLAAKASWTDNGGFANTLASAPTSAVAAASILPTLSIADASGAEDAGVTFTATLTAGVSAKVTATWTASIETDDTAVAADLATTKTGDVEFEPDTETTTFTVPVTDDSTDEDDETFTVTLSGVSTNAQLATDPTATGTIEDDDTAPTVTNVAVTSVPVLETDAYGAGETIDISVTFSEAVNATSDTDFVLSAGGAKRAPLVSGSGTETLAFGYTVAPGDEDDDGVWIGDQDRTLVGNRNGEPQNGAIASTATGVAADLDHAELGEQSGHKVDGTRSIRSVAVTSTPVVETDTYGEGETIRFTVTFNLAVNVAGDPVLTFALGNSGQSRDVDAAYESGSGAAALVFGYTVEPGDVDDNGVFLRDEEDFDNPDGPVRLDTGDSITFAGTSTDVPLYWQGRANQPGHKVNGLLSVDNNPPVFTEGETTTRTVAESSLPDIGSGGSGVDVGAPVVATDADNDDLTYTLKGADRYSFLFVEATGQIRTVPPAATIYATYFDEDAYQVEVEARDGRGGAATINVTINVTDTDDGPPEDEEEDDGPPEDEEEDDGPPEDEEEDDGPPEDEEEDDGPPEDEEEDDGPPEDEEEDDGPPEDEEDEDDAPAPHTAAPARLRIRALDANADSLSLHMSWQAPEANAADVTGYRFRIFEGPATRRVWPPVVDWTPVPEPLYERNGRYEHTVRLGLESAYTVWLRAALTNDGVSDHAQADVYHLHTVAVESEEPPDRVALIGNYPNPFNPSTGIVYELPEPGPVRLVVYDMIGREVRVLADAHRTAGRHTVRFDAEGLPTGTYACVLTAGSVAITRVMVLVR